MTNLLQSAFAKAATLSPEELDVLALRLLAELEVENQFDRAGDVLCSRWNRLSSGEGCRR